MTLAHELLLAANFSHDIMLGRSCVDDVIMYRTRVIIFADFAKCAPFVWRSIPNADQKSRVAKYSSIYGTAAAIRTFMAEVQHTMSIFLTSRKSRPCTEPKRSGAVVVSDSPPRTRRLLQISNASLYTQYPPSTTLLALLYLDCDILLCCIS